MSVSALINLVRENIIEEFNGFVRNSTTHNLVQILSVRADATLEQIEQAALDELASISENLLDLQEERDGSLTLMVNDHEHGDEHLANSQRLSNEISDLVLREREIQRILGSRDEPVEKTVRAAKKLKPVTEVLTSFDAGILNVIHQYL